MQTERVALAADDHLQLTNLLHLAMQYLDTGNGDAFAALFTDDGSVTILLARNKTVTRPDMAQFYRNLHDRFKLCMHWEGNVVLQVRAQKLQQMCVLCVSCCSYCIAGNRRWWCNKS